MHQQSRAIATTLVAIVASLIIGDTIVNTITVTLGLLRLWQTSRSQRSGNIYPYRFQFMR